MADNKVRLQKYLSECGVASRRKAEDLILAGKVKVNGKPASIGDKIDPKCDTVVVAGRRILQKACSAKEQFEVMKLLSGKAHRVLSGVCVISEDGKISVKCITTRILMKTLTHKEICDYVDSNEWVGCAGYKIEGQLSGFVKKMVGSYSGVVGLPLFEVRNMLNGVGIR